MFMPYTIAYLKSHRRLMLILLLALVLRLIYGLSLDHSIVYGGTGGDSGWYLLYGKALVTVGAPGPPPSAPFYLLFLGWWQMLFSPEGAVIFARIIQSLLGAATCYFAYRIGRALTGSVQVGLVVGAILAVSPAFVLEAGQVATETVYIFFITAGLWAYLELVSHPGWTAKHIALMMSIIGILFGLATLTRAVSLLFPLGLAFHFLLVSGWRAGLKPSIVLILVYSVVVSTWTFYNLVYWDYWVIGSQGMFSFLYLGAQEQGWTGPYAVDQQLEELVPGVEITAGAESHQQALEQGALQTIGRDPVGWLRLRLSNLVDAYLQPHGTTYFSGESVKDRLANWLRTDRTPGGLLELTQRDNFWPKLAIYVFHYVGLLGGVVGMWLCRKQWRLSLPLAGFILYTTLIHLVLLALPRYIFPTMVCWWVFASVAVVKALSAERRLLRSRNAALKTQNSEAV